MSYKIDKNVPIPGPTKQPMPFDQLKVGESFQTSRYIYCGPYNTKYAPKEFVCRKHEGVYRVWRVK
jgi:hypothetical protein